MPTIYPDPDLKTRENMQKMAAIDFQQKKACYEHCYGRKLTTDFSYEDIAGFAPCDGSLYSQLIASLHGVRFFNIISFPESIHQLE